ncbi:response regulator transcription factor [Massilia consociata]|uniref:Response regulator transcription factor n=1 Tax=Massilia consociata TaxID=760117 RepID=A0ABV6FFE5_9BURK
MNSQHITRRESEILQLLSRGMQNKYIARELGISPFTVRDHITCLLKKAGLRNRVELSLLVAQGNMLAREANGVS